MTGFRPFEHLAWSRTVPSGARYPMHVSGLAPPAPLEIVPPAWETWTGRERPLQSALLERLRAYLCAPGADGMVVSGAGGAVFLGMAGHVRHGTPVVVERPAYGAFERSVQFLGGVPVLYDRREKEGWRFDPERLDTLLIESGARLVGITDPHNPTGASIDLETRRAVVEVVERHGALLLVDETFASFRGPARSAAWCAASERVLTLGSLTKGWGLHALRAGWVLGAPELVAPCTQAFDLVGGNPPSATLALAREALTFAETLDERARQASLRVHTAFAGAGWVDGSMVGSRDGIIGFLRLPAGWDSERAARLLREQDGVQVVPGHFFGRDDHVRIGFDPERTDGAEGCRLIRDRLPAVKGWEVAGRDESRPGREGFKSSP